VQVEELWSLLHFIAPESFVEGPAPGIRLPLASDPATLVSIPRVFSRELFMSLFGDMRTSEQVTGLRGVLKPFLLRRLKEDVHASLPPKEETIIEVEMTVIQKQYYRAVYEHNSGFLVSSAASGQQAPSLVNIVMELRKVSDGEREGGSRLWICIQEPRLALACCRSAITPTFCGGLRTLSWRAQ
jgi:SNF2 family DNA or RNA helicase